MRSKHSAHSVFSQDFKVEVETWRVGVALGPEGVWEMPPSGKFWNFQISEMHFTVF